MKVTDMNNLFIAGHDHLGEKFKNFNILVIASDKEEAVAIAKDYFNHTNVIDRSEDTQLNVEPFDEETAKCGIDCDTVITGHDGE